MSHPENPYDGRYDVFCIVNSMPPAEWAKIGTAQRNTDGSIRVELVSIPLTGRFLLREFKP